MKIHVYAALKEYFNTEFELEESISNTDELKTCLLAINGQAVEILQTCRFAVEEGFIDSGFKLNNNDTVVIIPAGNVE